MVEIASQVFIIDSLVAVDILPSWNLTKSLKYREGVPKIQISVSISIKFIEVTFSGPQNRFDISKIALEIVDRSKL